MMMLIIMIMIMMLLMTMSTYFNEVEFTSNFGMKFLRFCRKFLIIISFDKCLAEYHSRTLNVLPS